MIDPVLIIPVSLCFALFWLSTAYHKASHNQWFQSVLKDYNVFPDWAVKPLSAGIPAIELSIALLLALTPVWGALASICLLAAYALLLAFNTLRGHILTDCGCAWGDHSSAGDHAGNMKFLVFRNVLLMFLSAPVLVPQTARSLNWFDWVGAILTVSSILILGLALSQLIKNYSRMKDFGHV